VHFSEDQSHVTVAPWLAWQSISNWFPEHCGDAGHSTSFCHTT
jgi:hypothetical protein